MKPNRKFCTVEREGKLTIITLRRPEVLNALHYEADLELQNVWNQFSEDPDQWVAILTGSGDRAFCVGNDLKVQAALGKRQMVPSGFGGLTMRFDLEKPIIAAINGMAMGGGFELALASDLIVADVNALFALPEPRIGTTAIAGGIQYLSRAIGLSRAMGILLTGRRVSAREGYELGFVTAVAQPGQSLVEARQWANEMLECSPSALRATKRMARRSAWGTGIELEVREAFTDPTIVRLRSSHDYREGPLAFSEKRKPQWVNN